MTADSDGHGEIGRLARPTGRAFDQDKVERGVRLILEGIGEDLDREGLRDTPARVARMYAEITSGLREDPTQVLEAVFEEGHDELIMVRDIPMASVCEHHLLPLIGKAELAQILAPVVKRPARGIMAPPPGHVRSNGGRSRDEAGIARAQDGSPSD